MEIAHHKQHISREINRNVFHCYVRSKHGRWNAAQPQEEQNHSQNCKIKFNNRRKLTDTQKVEQMLELTRNCREQQYKLDLIQWRNIGELKRTLSDRRAKRHQIVSGETVEVSEQSNVRDATETRCAERNSIVHCQW
jgi:hypothetical protein